MNTQLTSIITAFLLSSTSCHEHGTVKLMPPEDNAIYFSAYPFGEMDAYDRDVVTTERLRAFERLAQKKITWAAFSQYWGDGMAYPKEHIDVIANEGVIPLVRFEPRSRTNGYFTEYHAEPVFTLQNIIDGQFDTALRAWARDAKADNIPLLIDFGVEVNGQWFPWNGYWNGGGVRDGYGDPTYPDGPERFRDAYRHIICLFREENVTHVTWFFHVSMHTTEPSDEWNHPKYYYPGDDYIDWIGVSVYGELYPALQYWDSYDDVMEYDNAYEKVLAISSEKPFAILEMGVTDFSPDGSKAQWLRDAFASIRDDKYINFQAVNYWHENWDNNGSATTLEINSSAEVLQTFQEEIAHPLFISNGIFSQPSP